MARKMMLQLELPATLRTLEGGIALPVTILVAGARLKFLVPFEIGRAGKWATAMVALQVEALTAGQLRQTVTNNL
jgi:hypothetical protein